MIYLLSAGAVLFLFAFIVYMEYYKRRRLVQSLHALDRISVDHYEITAEDRAMQRASVKNPTI